MEEKERVQREGREIGSVQRMGSCWMEMTERMRITTRGKVIIAKAGGLFTDHDDPGKFPWAICCKFSACRHSRSLQEVTNVILNADGLQHQWDKNPNAALPLDSHATYP